jgi:autotransporter-associated beta strand protein
LELQGGISVPSVTTLTLRSTGTNNTGGLRNLGGSNTYGGAITLGAANSRINSDSGTLTLTNGVNGGANLVSLGGAGNVVVSTTTISGSAGLVKDGIGTNIWSLNPNISSGGVTINGGTFQINNGNFGGTFTPLITVNSGGTLLGNGTHPTGSGTSLVISNGTWLMNGEDYKQNLVLNRDALIGAGSSLQGSGADLRVGASGANGSWTWYASNSVAGAVVNSKLNLIGSGVSLTWNVLRGAATSDLTINGLVYSSGNFALTGNGITTLTATNTFSGTNLISGGTENVLGLLTGVTTNLVNDGATLNVKAVSGLATITNAASLTLGVSGATTLGIQNFIGSPVAPINVGSLVANGTVTILITNSSSRSIAPGQWPLIKYTGSIGGAGFGSFVLGALPRGVVAVLVNNVANGSVDLNVISSDQITWNGNISGVWDTNTTANWLWNGSGTIYQEPPVPGDGVLLDDTATGTTAVTLNQNVTPLSVTFNNTGKNYSLSGTGNINTNLSKNGTGDLTNSLAGFAGTIAVNAGAVEMLAGGDVGYTVAPGATLRHGFNNSGGYTKSLTLNGNGVSDPSGLYVQRGTTFSRQSMIFQSSNSTVRVFGTGGSAALQGFDVNGDFFTVTAAASGTTVDPSINFNAGSYGYSFNTAPGANTATGDLVVNGPIVGGGNAQVRGENIPSSLHKFGTGSLLLTGASTYTSGSAINGGSVMLSGGDNRLPTGTTVALGNGSANGKLILGGINQTLAGLLVNGTGTTNAVTGGAATFSTLTVTNGGTDTFAGILGGDGVNENNLALTKTGPGVLILSGTNTYVGDTDVNDGTLALASYGSIAGSSNLVLSGGAVLDASQRTDATLTLGANQTLSGIGSVNGTLMTASGSTLAPGGAVIGTLSLNSFSALGGSLIMKCSDANSPTSDQLVVGAPLIFGGTLTVTNIGPALQPGDTFDLFQAVVYLGGFSSIVLPPLNPPLVWNTSNLGVNGSITVQKAPTTVALTSSVNPSGYQDQVIFAATVQTNGVPAGDASGTVIFQANGVPFFTNSVAGGTTTSTNSSLARGTNVITAIYSGDSGYLSSSATLNQVVTNHPPAAALMTVHTSSGVSVKIKLSDIATNWSDVDADTISLTAINLSSTNGVPLTLLNVTTNLDGSYVVANNAFLGYPGTTNANDQLSYTISDGQGGSMTGLINIAVSGGLSSGQVTGIIATGGGPVTVSFAGIPGYTYIVQRTTNFVDWSPILTTNAPAQGLFQYTDNFSDLGGTPPSSAAYRLGWTP